MVDSPSRPDPPESESSKPFPLPSWKKVSEFIVGVFQLQRSVKTLEEQNRKIQERVERMQRQLDEQAGQLKTILFLIESTVHERAARTAEDAAVKVVRQFLAFRGEEAAGEPREERSGSTIKD